MPKLCIIAEDKFIYACKSVLTKQIVITTCIKLIIHCTVLWYYMFDVLYCCTPDSVQSVACIGSLNSFYKPVVD